MPSCLALAVELDTEPLARRKCAAAVVAAVGVTADGDDSADVAGAQRAHCGGARAVAARGSSPRRMLLQGRRGVSFLQGRDLQCVQRWA